MKIIYHQNPLRTKVILDDHEKQIMRLKIKISELEDMICSTRFHLYDGTDYYDVAQAAKECTYNEAAVDEEVDHMMGYLLPDLEGGYHCGDCTCIPCSCSKCRAEEFAGVKTTAGLGKHSAHKIDAFFGTDDDKTADQCIEWLRGYEQRLRSKPMPDNWNRPQLGKERYEACIPAWVAQANSALEWMIKYRDEKLNDQSL